MNTFGIGDVLFTTPLVRMLKNAIPEANIDFMCNARTRYILRNNKNINELIIYEKDEFRGAFKRSKAKFIRKLLTFFKRIWLKKYDLVIDLSLGYQSSLVLMLLGVKKRIGFNYRDRGRFLTDKINLNGFEEKHVVMYYMDLLKPLGIKEPRHIPIETFTSKEDDEWALSFIKENGLDGKLVVGVVPGGGKSWGSDARYRRWPASNFAHVADKLIDTLNASVILFGDKSEKGLCDNVQAFMHKNILNMGGKTTVGKFMSLMKKCKLILCNEGGPLHIAVALKKPTVSIFGPVDEKIYGPYTNNTAENIVVSERQKCSPCYTRFRHKECPTITCLESISEEKIFDAVKELIKST